MSSCYLRFLNAFGNRGRRARIADGRLSTSRRPCSCSSWSCNNGGSFASKPSTAGSSTTQTCASTWDSQRCPTVLPCRVAIRTSTLSCRTLLLFWGSMPKILTPSSLVRTSTRIRACSSDSPRGRSARCLGERTGSTRRYPGWRWGWIGILNAILPPPRQGDVYRVFLPHLRINFYLYTEQMSSIVAGNSWHFHHFPPGRGGSYGASGGHLRTSGSQRHGALPRDRGAPGDLSRLTRGCPRGHRLARLCGT